MYGPQSSLQKTLLIEGLAILSYSVVKNQGLTSFVRKSWDGLGIELEGHKIELRYGLELEIDCKIYRVLVPSVYDYASLYNVVQLESHIVKLSMLVVP